MFLSRCWIISSKIKDSGNLTFDDFSKKTTPKNEVSDSYKNGDFLILSQTHRKTRREDTYENFYVWFLKNFQKIFQD